MIELKRLNGQKFMLNPDLIEQIEKTPDTVITLITGNNIPVLETIEEVKEKFLEFKQKIYKEDVIAKRVVTRRSNVADSGFRLPHPSGSQ